MFYSFMDLVLELCVVQFHSMYLVHLCGLFCKRRDFIVLAVVSIVPVVETNLHNILKAKIKCMFDYKRNIPIDHVCTFALCS